ncbi:hypothetical protein MB46_19595 (plasmid) [Arthrobacter alpinus]|uniref:hypothetical protein n=1 Tax=Arthrobacter alpinus TaxID=656366 RepID=UPI0005C8A8DF|nr:hypothetical protein [Arthrobacter alpinus]ALV47877.1 hypothetical protein MB46_19595 [Arthrobacter alpinus]
MARSSLPGSMTPDEAKEKYGIDLHDPRYEVLEDREMTGTLWPGNPYMVYPGPGEHNEDTRKTIEVLESLGAWVEVRSVEDMAADGTVLPAGHAWPVVDDVGHEIWAGYDPEKLIRKANDVALTPASVPGAFEAYVKDNFGETILPEVLRVDLEKAFLRNETIRAIGSANALENMTEEIRDILLEDVVLDEVETFAAGVVRLPELTPDEVEAVTYLRSNYVAKRAAWKAAAADDPNLLDLAAECETAEFTLARKVEALYQVAANRTFATSPFAVMFGADNASSLSVEGGLPWESIKPRDYAPANKSEWKHLSEVHKDGNTVGYVDLGNGKEITTLARAKDEHEPNSPRDREETLYRVGTDRWLLGKTATEAFQINTSHEISDESALEWLGASGWTVIDHVSDFDYPRSESGPVYLRGSILQSIDKADVIVSENSSLAEPGKAAVTVVGRSELAGELHQQGTSPTNQPRTPFRENTLDAQAHHIVETLEISTAEHTTLH